MSKQLHFFIPAFFDVYDRYAKSGQACKSVVQAYNKGKKRCELPLGLEAALCRCFGIYEARDRDLAIAALTAEYDELKDVDEKTWICRADPVHMRADRDQLVLFGGDQLLIDAEERAQLEKDFNDFFGDTGLILHAASVSRWYLSSEREWRFRAHPLSEMEGQGVSDKLPYGEDAEELRRLTNEIQMFFFNHPVNQTRHASSVHFPINGLWLWGAGKKASLSLSADAQRWDGVYSDEALARGLARFTGTSDEGYPESIKTFLQQTSDGRYLFSCDDFYTMRQYEQWGPLMDKLAAFEMQWLHEIIDAVKKGELECCELSDEQGYCWRISTDDLAPFTAWRKKWLGR